MKGVSFINRRYTKGGTFLSKTVYKRVRGRTSGWSLPVYRFCGSPKNARLRGRPNVFPVVALQTFLGVRTPKNVCVGGYLASLERLSSRRSRGHQRRPEVTRASVIVLHMCLRPRGQVADARTPLLKFKIEREILVFESSSLGKNYS